MSLSHALGWAAPLQIQVDGVNTTRTAFCVGENVTLTCTVASSAHRWNIPGFTINNGVAFFLESDSAVSVNQSHNEIILDIKSGTDLITSASFIVFPEVEGLVFTCSYPSSMVPPQTYTGAVLGETSGGYMSCVHHLISRFASDI